MINALYELFPDSVNVCGEELGVLTDFKAWLRFSDMLSDKELTQQDKLLLMPEWFTDTIRLTQAHVNALIGFCRADALSPDNEEYCEEKEHVRHSPILDYRYDAAYILGDFLRYYGIDLRTAQMHWWRFRLLITALPSESHTMTRIAYRSADLSQIKNESERRRIMRIQRAVALPFEMDDEDIGAAFSDF